MSTAPTQTLAVTTRTVTPPGMGRSSQPTSGGSAMGFVAIDPVRLLKRYYPLLGLAAIVGATLGFGAHHALLRLYPTYTSAATFACFPPVTSVKETVQAPQGADETARFIGTQVAMMTSDQILQAALQNPQLEQTDWAKQYHVNGRLQPALAQRALSKIVTARTVPTTNLIKMSMSWRKPTDTAVIVNAVKDAYMEDVRRTQRLTGVEKRDVLNGRLKQINDEIKRNNSARDQLLQEGSVSDLDNGATSENVKIGHSSEKLTDAKADLSTIRSLQEKYAALLKSSGTPAYPSELHEQISVDPIIRDLESQVALLKLEERSLRARGVLEAHLTLQNIIKRTESVELELAAHREQALRKLFDERFDSMRTQEAALMAQEVELTKEIAEANKRKEDLLRIRLRVEQIDTAVEALQTEQTEITQAMQNMDSLAMQPIYDRVRVVRTAQTPDEVAFPKLKILLPLGVVLITGLVAGVVVLRELLDQRVRGPADLAVIPRLRILGMVPDAQEDPARPAAVETAFRDSSASVITESFRQIRSLIVKKMSLEGRRSLVVAGGMPGSGATTVVTNLGFACAGAGERVLLVDANFRRPALHKTFKIAEGPGLGELLAGETTLDAALRDTGTPNLQVISAGSAAARSIPERLASEAMTRFINEASNRFDRVIIDVPPAIVSGDGLAIANRTDAVVLVARALHEKRGLVNRLRAQFSETQAELMGIIVNGVRSSAGGYLRGNIQATHDYQKAN